MSRDQLHSMRKTALLVAKSEIQNPRHNEFKRRAQTLADVLDVAIDQISEMESIYFDWDDPK